MVHDWQLLGECKHYFGTEEVTKHNYQLYGWCPIYKFNKVMVLRTWFWSQGVTDRSTHDWVNNDSLSSDLVLGECNINLERRK